MIQVAVMQHLRRHTKIPVPDIYFWDNTEDNVLGHEYICMERMLAIPNSLLNLTNHTHTS